ARARRRAPDREARMICRCHADAVALAARVRELLAAIEWQRTPETERDAAILATIASFVGRSEFTAAELCGQALQSPRAGAGDLRRALASRDALAARKLGKYLARIEGQLLDSHVVESTG